MDTKIIEELDGLLKLKSINSANTQIRALSYQLYENNGVVKREEVLDIINNLNQDDRKTLRNLGVKFGRYHIFLFKLFKPSVVSLRILLWKNFNGEDLNLFPPTFGLNFVNNVKYKNKKFMLLCGFEKFDSFFVRIDILERLFMQIISKNSEKNNEIKMVPEMLNLLGCNKDNFKKLLKIMEYKITEKNNEVYFRYFPKKDFKKPNKKIIKESPFGILKNLNLIINNKYDS